MVKIEFPEGFIEELEVLCDSYDVLYCDYPEHEYEGAALFEYKMKTWKIANARYWKEGGDC